MKSVTLISHGEKVWLKTFDSELPAVVLACAIYPEMQVQYLVEWWDGRQRRQEWAYAMNVKPNASVPKKMTIGFSS